MKTFEEIFNELQNNNTEIDDIFKKLQTKKYKAKKISLTICLILDILLTILFILIINNLSIFYIIPVITFTIILNLLIFGIVNTFVGTNNVQLEFDNKYKDIVIKRLINNFYDNIEYFPNKEMPEYIYDKPNYEYYDIYNSNDYFEGLINNKYSIQMADILTEEEETYKDSKGNTHTRTITKFHGLFAKIVIDKSINSYLEIMLNGNIPFGKDKLNMDSSEFEKYFDVKTSNKIIGMQLLTADIMESLINFKNNTNMNYDIHINNNEIYLRFHSGEMFEADNFKKSALDKDTIYQYFYMLNFTYNLSTKLINIINETQL